MAHLQEETALLRGQLDPLQARILATLYPSLIPNATLLRYDIDAQKARKLVTAFVGGDEVSEPVTPKRVLFPPTQKSKSGMARELLDLISAMAEQSSNGTHSRHLLIRLYQILSRRLLMLVQDNPNINTEAERQLLRELRLCARDLAASEIAEIKYGSMKPCDDFESLENEPTSGTNKSGRLDNEPTSFIDEFGRIVDGLNPADYDGVLRLCTKLEELISLETIVLEEEADAKGLKDPQERKAFVGKQLQEYLENSFPDLRWLRSGTYASQVNKGDGLGQGHTSTGDDAWLDRRFSELDEHDGNGASGSSQPRNEGQRAPETVT